MTVGDYLDSWLKGSVRGSVRDSTFERYEIAVRVHIKQLLYHQEFGDEARRAVGGRWRGHTAAADGP